MKIMITKTKNEPVLSIVIISMNNFNDVLQCIDSICMYHDITNFEMFLLAYNFSKDSLNIIKEKYSFLKVLESYGIKGFAENNNIALNYVTGKFCLILNDDTYFKDSSLVKMIDIMNENDQIKLLSPHILNVDGTTQILGRPKYNIINFILHELKLDSWSYVGNTRNEIFKTYSLSGACFIIDTDLFKKVGFFDEKYFFTPEDIALSTKTIRAGYYPYIYQKSCVYHKLSTTAKNIHQITIPVGKQGSYLYFREFFGKRVEILIRIYILILTTLKYIYWLAFKSKSTRRDIMLSANLNCIKYSTKSIDPKVLFTLLISK